MKLSNFRKYNYHKNITTDQRNKINNKQNRNDNETTETNTKTQLSIILIMVMKVAKAEPSF